MPLGVREVLFVMRARDEASRTIIGLGSVFGQVGTRAEELGGRLVGVGSAMSGIGVGMAATGALIFGVFDKMTNAAIEYRQQAALTLTQVDGFKASLHDVEKIGLDVAKAIPAPLEELQPALFDIFSSMDVGLGSARKLLEGFAKAAVAGQVDVQTAGRATIAIMNAFKIPVSDLNKVLDVQFQLVRKGVGTYEEFSRSIGLAIPSAVRAGQSLETLAGMLAFMTRNGLSTSRAATSVARALDSMSNPVTVQRMEQMGVSVKNAQGEFRPMTEIVGQLSEKLQGMTTPQRVAALKDLFSGAGGTIQARRFWDLAVTNFSELNKLVIDMGEGHAAGALQKAYDIMFQQPQSQVQLFQNRIKALEIEIGQGLIPIKMKLLEIGTSLIKMWEDLPGPVKDAIVIFGLVTAALLVLGGTVTAVTGALTALKGLFMMMGGSEIIGALSGLLSSSTVFTQIGVWAIQAGEGVSAFFDAVTGAGALGEFLPVLGAASLQFAGLFLAVGLVSYGILKLAEHFGIIKIKADPLVAQQAELASSFAKNTLATDGLIKGYQNIAKEYDNTGGALKRYNTLVDAARAFENSLNGEHLTSAGAVKASASATRELDAAYDKLTTHQKYVIGSLADVKAGLLSTGDTMNPVLERIRALGLYHDDLGKILDKLEPKYRKQVEQLKEAAKASDQFATSIGVTLPEGMGLSTKGAKAFDTQLAATTANIGAQQASLEVYLLGIENHGDDIVAVMKQINDGTKQFSKSIEGSVGEFTDVWKHFAEATAVSEGEMEKFFVGSRQQAIDWTADVRTIISMGVDQGIVQQLAAAGPKSEPAVKAFIAMVQEHGVDFVNNWQHDMDSAVAATEVAFTQMEIAGAIHSAELSAVAQAAMLDLQEGGTAHLQALAAQGGGAFTDLANKAIEQLGLIRGEAAKPMPPVVITGDASGAWNDINNIKAALSQLTDRPWMVHVDVARAAQDIQNLQAMGALGPSYQQGGLIPGGINEPYPIVAHGGEFVLSADVVRRIKQGLPSEGASLSAGMTMSSGGPTTYTVVVHATSQANPYQIGKEISWVQATNPWVTPSRNDLS